MEFILSLKPRAFGDRFRCLRLHLPAELHCEAAGVHQQVSRSGAAPEELLASPAVSTAPAAVAGSWHRAALRRLLQPLQRPGRLPAFRTDGWRAVAGGLPSGGGLRRADVAGPPGAALGEDEPLPLAARAGGAGTGAGGWSTQDVAGSPPGLEISPCFAKDLNRVLAARPRFGQFR